MTRCSFCIKLTNITAQKTGLPKEARLYNRTFKM